jgi:hypothetical protein
LKSYYSFAKNAPWGHLLREGIKYDVNGMLRLVFVSVVVLMRIGDATESTETQARVIHSERRMMCWKIPF